VLESTAREGESPVAKKDKIPQSHFSNRPRFLESLRLGILSKMGGMFLPNLK